MFMTWIRFFFFQGGSMMRIHNPDPHENESYALVKTLKMFTLAYLERKSMFSERRTQRRSSSLAYPRTADFFMSFCPSMLEWLVRTRTVSILSPRQRTCTAASSPRLVRVIPQSTWITSRIREVSIPRLSSDPSSSNLRLSIHCTACVL